MPLVVPTIEPLLRSKAERISGKGPSLWAQFRHVFRHWVPSWVFILKWVSAGTFVLTVCTCVLVFSIPYKLASENEKARDRRAADVAETNRKEKVELERAAEAAEFEALEVHAKGNWETWKSQFTTDADGIACAYGHIFNEHQKLFEISCQLGPKGHLPTALVVCNQSSCRVATPTPEVKK
jgi:hypothetical protein